MRVSLTVFFKVEAGLIAVMSERQAVLSGFSLRKGAGENKAMIQINEISFSNCFTVPTFRNPINTLIPNFQILCEYRA